MLPLLTRPGAQLSLIKKRTILAGSKGYAYDYSEFGSIMTEDGICLLPFAGAMMKGCGGYGACDQTIMQAAARAAADNQQCRAAVMVWDSPGGSVAGTDELHMELKALAAKKPLYAVVEGDMCSAAYWAGCAASKIYATRTSIIGSIGVRMEFQDASAFYEKMGIKYTELTTGEYKAAGTDTRPMTDAERAYFQGNIDALADMFYGVVASNRGMSKKSVKDLEAKFFLGEDAVKCGLADDLLSLEDVLGKVRSTLKRSGPKAQSACRERDIELTLLENPT